MTLRIAPPVAAMVLRRTACSMARSGEEAIIETAGAPFLAGRGERGGDRTRIGKDDCGQRLAGGWVPE